MLTKSNEDQVLRVNFDPSNLNQFVTKLWSFWNTWLS